MRRIVFDMNGDYGVMHFPCGVDVLFDKEDYKKISKYSNWQINNDGKGTTRVRAIVTNAEGKKSYTEMSVALGYPMYHTTHINGNWYDMRKENLAIKTNQQISYSSKVPVTCKSGVKGVRKIAENKYSATITYHGDKYYLGTYDVKEKAVKARLLAEDIYCHGSLCASQKFLHKVFGN